MGIKLWIYPKERIVYMDINIICRYLRLLFVTLSIDTDMDKKPKKVKTITKVYSKVLEDMK
jgi:hypothetical protein